ncbi:heavy metal-associated isoprenylated plant protein 16-like [Lotus japonicus]|uniref:heavy metal-associated isoprenylated plant protein 16-like n=1 Tax=Lotus japonicus TaxID=34305 RepID=UPI00258E7FE1|nr:heavy metal-associated isoprenylated plant protein 16-like [Lotus japonicus]
MKKIVIEVHMNDDKCRSKALKIAAAFQGVNSMSLEGESRDQLVVTGDIDSVSLTNKLRKKFSYATLLGVGDMEDSNNKGGDAGGTKENVTIEDSNNKGGNIGGTEENVTTSTENISIPYSYANYPPPLFHVVYDPYPSSCSIL